MPKLIKRRGSIAGLSPGSLIHFGEKSTSAVTFRFTEYSKTTYKELDNPSLDECLETSKSTTNNVWIEVNGVHDPAILEKIGSHFGFHPLSMEDIISTRQQSKIDDYHDYLFIVLRALHYNAATDEIEDEQVSMFLGKHFLVSFIENPNGLFSPIHERLKKDSGRMRISGPDYLCYALIDCIVDHYFVILEKVDDRLESLERELLAPRASYQTVQKIQQAKHTVMQLRRIIWPLREVVSQFSRIETPLINKSTVVFMRDVYDHTIQAIDTIDSFRDLSTGMIDVYLSSVNSRMNEIMKVLTVVSTFFVPITFISSIYGMNFDYMPELHWHYGYPLVLCVMTLICLGMLIFFKKRRWL